jgi:hypothetical protein
MEYEKLLLLLLALLDGRSVRLRGGGSSPKSIELRVRRRIPKSSSRRFSDGDRLQARRVREGGGEGDRGAWRRGWRVRTGSPSFQSGLGARRLRAGAGEG